MTCKPALGIKPTCEGTLGFSLLVPERFKMLTPRKACTLAGGFVSKSSPCAKYWPAVPIYYLTHSPGLLY